MTPEQLRQARIVNGRDAATLRQMRRWIIDRIARSEVQDAERLTLQWLLDTFPSSTASDVVSLVSEMAVERAISRDVFDIS